MVKQTRIIFTLGDVVQIRFVCPKCDGAMTQKLDASERLPDQCPSCKQPWSKEPGIQVAVIKYSWKRYGITWSKMCFTCSCNWNWMARRRSDTEAYHQKQRK